MKILLEDRKQGFTIIEVMIVMAVTSVIFFMATQFISGKEQYNAFKIAANNLQTEYKQILDNVSNGYYPPQNFNCMVSEAGTKPYLSSIANFSQGANWGCIFLGDAVQVQPTQLIIYPIIGNRQSSNGNNATSLIDDSTTAIVSSIIEPEHYSYGYSLSAICMQASTVSTATCNSNKTLDSYPIMSFAVGIGSVSSQSNQSLQLIPLYNLNSSNSLNISQNNFIKNFNLASDIYIGLNKLPIGGIQICYVSGGSNDSALFQIGGNGSVNNVSYYIYNNRTCS